MPKRLQSELKHDVVTVAGRGDLAVGGVRDWLTTAEQFGPVKVRREKRCPGMDRETLRRAPAHPSGTNVWRSAAWSSETDRSTGPWPATRWPATRWSAPMVQVGSGRDNAAMESLYALALRKFLY